MFVTKQPTLRKSWYATVALSRVDDGPQPFTLLRGADRPVEGRRRPSRGAHGSLLPPHREALAQLGGTRSSAAITRRGGFHMESDRVGLLMRQHLLALLHEHGEEEAHL
jgi:hypothetical protein